jgi:predicted enzyme related to lactoylglutathione lyase
VSGVSFTRIRFATSARLCGLRRVVKRECAEALTAAAGVAFDDEFVAGGGEPVDGGLGQHRISRRRRAAAEAALPAHQRRRRTRSNLEVDDLAPAAAFLREVLGFEVEVDEPGMGLVLLRRDAVGLALVQSATPGVNAATAAYIGVTGVDDLHEQCTARGAQIVTGLADHPWGLRDFVVEIPGGHRLALGERIAPPRLCQLQPQITRWVRAADKQQRDEAPHADRRFLASLNIQASITGRDRQNVHEAPVSPNRRG